MKVWRREPRRPAAPISDDNAYNPNDDERYRAGAAGPAPRTECLQDVVARVAPYWDEVLAPDLRAGRTVLVGRARQQPAGAGQALDGIADADIVELNIPTGEPLVYDLDDDLRPVEAKPVDERYLRDPAEIRAAAEAVARQAEGGQVEQ